MIDLKKTYRTRDGRKVKLYSVDNGGQCPIHGAYFNGETWRAVSWMSSGKYHLGSHISNMDLVEGPQTITKWANVFPNGTVNFYNSKEMAETVVGTYSSRIACVPVTIEYTEGEGLEEIYE